MLKFANAVRILYDPDQPEDLRAGADTVRLAAFYDEDGGMSIRKSLKGSEVTTWHTYFQKDQDLSQITPDQLVPDPTNLDVFYLIFEGEEASYRSKISTRHEPVDTYICQILNDEVRSAQTPQKPGFGPNGPTPAAGLGKKSPTAPRKDFLITMTKEDYFNHRLRCILIPAFLNLLKTPLPGYTKDGLQEGGEGNEDLLLLVVEQAQNFDPTSTRLYASFATKIKKPRLK